MLIKMTISGLMLDPFNHVPIVILRDEEGKNAVPIWIGIQEALAIDIKLHPEKNTITRPMTHDLMKNIIDAFEMQVTKIVVNDLRDNTFYAEIHIEKDGQHMVIDARPSDSIALALRTESPIWVDEKVIKQSENPEVDGQEDTEHAGQTNAGGKWIPQEKWEEILKNLSPEDFGKYKM